MRRLVFFLAILLLSFSGYSQTLQYLNFAKKPVLDTAKYGYEYRELITVADGVIHQQLFTRDTVKIRHTTTLLDDQGNKRSKRELGYFTNGVMEFSTRTDFEKGETRQKYFYSSGALKSELAMWGDEVTSEVYYSEIGAEIAKPVIEEPSAKGGENGWYSYLAGTMRYPAEARAAKAEGTVLLAFEVDENGTVGNIRVGNAEFIHEALWKEAVRVIESYPHRWTPKTENGVAVSSEVTLPLRFVLS
ncbi:hypothetical protein GCM10009119_29280 [Algoriphagus jejuensis]|uniref:TonB C-terminal domain-containing protein n=1 Tax=Algoriphagus jejuensis TaxID=419934 RepID=A0ABP3YEU6_9BACT